MSESGQVFAIEEFSTFDGPGIRTTVFLKGCPLRCSWCHNPEGQRFEAEIVRSPNGCTGCGRCLDAGEAEAGRRVLTSLSIGACPNGMVRQCGDSFTPDALIARLSRNFPILSANGGGITFSGGEPLARPVFLLACLRGLRGRVHRAVQTSGFAPAECFREMLDEVDLVLFDVKLVDEASHLRHTGMSNQVILQNLEQLARSSVPLHLRTPLIPGVTDTAENCEAVALLARRLGIDRIELLPYNTLAGAKYPLVGRAYAPEFDAGRPVETHVELFEARGISVHVL